MSRAKSLLDPLRSRRFLLPGCVKNLPEILMYSYVHSGLSQIFSHPGTKILGFKRDLFKFGIAILFLSSSSEPAVSMEQTAITSQQSVGMVKGNTVQSGIGPSNFSVMLKTCGNPAMVSINQSLDFYKMYKGSRMSCIEELPKNSNLVEAKTLFQKIAAAENSMVAKIGVRMQSMLPLEREYINEVANSMMTLSTLDDGSLDSSHYASLDPKFIDYMFTLCNAAYYSKQYAKNENNTSDRYLKRITVQKAYIAGLQRTLTKVEKFREMISKMFSPDVVAQLNKTQKHNQADSNSQHLGVSQAQGMYGQGFGFDSKNKVDEHAFSQQHSGKMFNRGGSIGADQEQSHIHETQLDDIYIKSLAPDMVRGIVESYRSLFNKDLMAKEKNATLQDVERDLNKIELETKLELIDADRSLKIMSNPQVGEFFAKMDSIFDRLSEGFMPIDVFYRNVKKGKSLGIFQPFTKTKQNANADISGKEFSGIVLYKPDNKDKEQKLDQLVFAFSGSNSKADWDRNLDALTSQGTSTGIAIGMNVHNGIKNLFDDSIQENGTKLKRWFDQYAAQYQPDQPNKPTLRIYLTGHSLGGALAMLMALYIEQNIAPNYSDRINIDVKVYTFGAPPIYSSESAKRFESLVGKWNIIRVWNIGDPVANLSLLKQSEKYFKRSLIMALLGVQHVGISVPLRNEGPEKMGNFLDGPWSNHGSDRYRNLIYLNATELGNLQSAQANKSVKSNELLQDIITLKEIEQIKEFLRYQGSTPALLVGSIAPNKLLKLIEATPVQQSPQKRTVEYYDQVREQGYDARKQKMAEPQLGMADTNELKYTQQLLIGPVPITIRRNSSCEIGNIIKQNNIGYRLDVADQAELSCGCCLSKNFFVSKDGSLVGKLRDLFGKKINTIDQVYSYCLKYCAPLQGKIFSPGQSANVNELGRFMESLGLGNLWRNKSFK